MRIHELKNEFAKPWENFPGVKLIGTTFKFKTGKGTSRFVFSPSKQSEINTFHVVVDHRRQENVPVRVMHAQSFGSAHSIYRFFNVLSSLSLLNLLNRVWEGSIC